MLLIICAFLALFLRSIDCSPSITKCLIGCEKDFWKEKDFGSVKQLNICFEKREKAYQVEYGLVEKAIKKTWENALSPSLKFAFLTQPCGAIGGSTQLHIRIQVNNTARPQSIIGRHLLDVPNGMILNFLFTGWSTGYCSPKNEYNDNPIFGRIPRRHFCIMAIAVHEFGHALGFRHEQDREDAPKACRDKQVREENVNAADFLTLRGMLQVSPYDKDSIMNYCNEKWNNDGILSACDRYGVVKVYRKYDDKQLRSQCIKSVGHLRSNSSG